MDELNKACRYDHVDAYYIINFRRDALTYAVAADTVYAFAKTAQRRSLTEEWCRETGILIEQKLKIKRYIFDVMNLLNLRE